MGELEAAFWNRRVLSLASVKEVLGTESRMTAFRCLKALAYRSSYSHRGMYYTLDDIPDYDANGVWIYDAVCFSCYGTLLSSVEVLVRQSAGGCTAAELEWMLHVRVQNAVKTLVDRGQLSRRQVGSEYVYVEPGKSALQLAARKRDLELGFGRLRAWAGGPEDMAKHLTTFLSTLNEGQRRLYLGFESLKLGHGGDAAMAALAGVNVKTVARGRRELAAQAVTVDRVRAAGAGRPALKKTT